MALGRFSFLNKNDFIHGIIIPKIQERSWIMIFVTKEEFEKIKEKIPDVRMTITSKYHKAKRKKRWIEEDPAVLEVLNQIRNN